MDMPMQKILGALGTVPGQGCLLEQLDKRLRKEQRRIMFELVERISEEEANSLPVMLYKAVPPDGKRRPALLRFYLPTWRGYDEVFWQALGDYVILTLHRVKDLQFDSDQGKMKVEYFVKTSGRVRSPEEILGIVQKIAFLVDTETLPTDFTRFRSMAERREQIGDMSKTEAAAVGALLKFLPF